MFVVTGANGFIGSNMVKLLNANNKTNIICTDHVSPEERPKPLSSCQYSDFITPNQLFDFLQSHKNEIQCIFHMGACSNTQEFDENYLQKNNTEYTNKLFEFCTENSQCVYIYASSGAVYGKGELGFSDLTDSKQLKPLNPYGWSKVKSDIWILEQQKTPLHWYGFRFFNVYGPHEEHKENMRSVVHKAYEQIRRDGTLQLFKSEHPDYEDGMQMRDFIYVKDVVQWMWDTFHKKNIASGIYNMGMGEARPWLDLASAVFKNMDLPIDIDWISMPTSLKDKYQYFTKAEMGKFFNQGMQKPSWPLEKGIEDYVKNYLVAEDGCLQEN